MTLLRTIAGVVGSGLRRLRRHPGSAALLVVGLVAPVAVAVAVPAYSSASSGRLFDRQIVDDAGTDAGGAGVTSASDRLSLLYSFNRLSGGTRSWEDVAELDALLLDGARLPVGAVDRFVETRPLPFFVDDERLGNLSVASVTGFESDVALVAGRLPAAGASPVEVLVEATFAMQQDLTVGRRLVARTGTSAGGGELDVVVVGVWTDPLDPLGAVGASTATEAGTRPSAPFGDADAFRRRLLVPHDTIVDVMSPVLGAGIENLRWRLALDPARFTGDDVGSVLGRIERLSATAERLLPGTRALRTPNGPLRAFRDDERRLRDGLASFSAPLVVLSVAVALMLVGIALRSRLGEFTSLRRRGVTRSSLVAGAIPEAAVIAAVATGVGVIVGLGLARAIGSTDTFFRFGGADDLAISMTDDAWWSAGRAGVALVLVQLLPLALLVWRIAPGGRSGGTSDRPWFQRSNLDIATVAAVAIVTWRGVTSDGGRSELIDDPAIVLLPSAAAVAGGLVILRLMPLIMRGAAAALARTDRAATLVAARRAARVPADLATPLLLLVVTASLATFTASLATTLDLQLADDVLHRNGGPVRIIDDGRPVSIASTSTPSTDEQLPLPPRTTNRHASLDAYERIWGIVRASPSIEVDGSAVHDGGTIAGFTFRGIDPITFAETSFWRPDYADRDLAALMGELVGRPDAILISEELRRTERLEVGDELRLDLLTNGGELRLATTIVGSFDQFPRWYPDRESPLIVGRADVVETLTGSTHARSVVVEVDERFGDRTQVEQDLAMFGASSLRVSSAALAIEDGRADPGRQGVLGLLTIGVAVATALTLVGFVVSTVGSLRRRTTEIGVLRAMGMTRREVGTMALFDLAAVMALGLAAALALGVGFSRWFIPVLVDTPPGAAPELLPAIAWSAIAAVAVALAGLLVVASSLVIVFVRRVRLDEAIRLGEG